MSYLLESQKINTVLIYLKCLLHKSIKTIFSLYPDTSTTFSVCLILYCFYIWFRTTADKNTADNRKNSQHCKGIKKIQKELYFENDIQ